MVAAVTVRIDLLLHAGITGAHTVVVVHAVETEDARREELDWDSLPTMVMGVVRFSHIHVHAHSSVRQHKQTMKRDVAATGWIQQDEGKIACAGACKKSSRKGYSRLLLLLWYRLRYH
jgi:hypothetical protein